MADLQFHDSYQQCRAAMIDLCGAGQLTHDTYELPGHTGPDGETLAMDTFWYGDSQADHLLVLSSGMHGVEGPAGSNAQRAWLRQKLSEDLPENVAILIVHAINPWGFAHGARTNENNVDLNRNFLPSDYERAHPPETETYHDALTLKDLSAEGLQQANEKIRGLMERDGPRFLTLASGGQSLFPDGLNYMGAEPQWSTDTLRAVFKTHLPGRKSVLSIDLHTGLGPYGMPHLLNFAKQGSPQYILNLDIYGHSLMRTQEAAADHTADAEYVGLPVNDLVAHAAAASNVSGVVIEIGTLDLGDIIPCVLRENCVRRLGLEHTPEGQAALTAFQQAFSPADPTWQTNAVNGFSACIDRAYKKLKALAADR